MDYLDFDLEIGEGTGREYPVAVLRSPAGETRATMRFPYDELALENRLLTLQNALLRSGGKRRSVLSPEQQAVRDFGGALFDALIAGEVRSRYDVSLERAQQAGKGLRLRLRFRSPTLAALPWEFLYDDREAEYVCLTTGTPLVRYLELPRPPQALAVAPPLHILGAVCSPRDLATLDVDNEKRRVEQALQDLRDRGLAELHWMAEPTWRALQGEMRRGRWHIFHFVGHGGFDVSADEGLIYLADEDGKARPLRATELGRLLADQPHLRLAVLNACEGARGGERDIFSSTASILVRRGLPAVVAMQYEITDRAAIELSRSFYEALADNLPVDAAVTEARKAVSLAVTNTVEWGTPVLYMRSPDGRLFHVEERKPGTEAVRGPEREATARADQKPAPSQIQEPKPALEEPVSPVGTEAPPTTTAKTAQPVQPEVKQPAPTVRTEAPAPAKAVAVSALAGDLVTIDKPIHLELIRIPAGPFLVSRDKRTVEVAEFSIGKYPVTNAQYAAFVQAKNYRKPQHWKDELILAGKESHPVVNVSWHDAIAFCDWLSKATGRTFRLPTEAEWEKAASWDAPAVDKEIGKHPGGTSKQGVMQRVIGQAKLGGKKRTYPWGDTFDKNKCNTGESDIGDTTPVGKYSPAGDSPYGVADMAGNVWEWCLNEYDNPDRVQLEGDAWRVLRGGSWNDDPNRAASAFRFRFYPDFRSSFYGFRVVVVGWRPNA